MTSSLRRAAVAVSFYNFICRYIFWNQEEDNEIIIELSLLPLIVCPLSLPLRILFK